MRHLRRWGALYLLLGLFGGSIAGQYVAMVSDGTDGEFWAATLENWQSEWLQLSFQFLLLGFGHQLFKAEKEDEERLEAKIDRLLQGQSTSGENKMEQWTQVGEDTWLMRHEDGGVEIAQGNSAEEAVTVALMTKDQWISAVAAMSMYGITPISQDHARRLHDGGIVTR